MNQSEFDRAVWLFWQRVANRIQAWSGHVEGSPADGYEDELDVDPLGWVP